MSIGPFWRYYGGKWRAAPRYPAPHYGTIVEPFAGAAGYACRHWRKRVQLYDVDEHVVATWRYLLTEDPDVIATLPDVPDGATVDDLDICDEARLLIGWWLNTASSAPRKRPSAWALTGRSPRWRDVRQRVARDAEAIRETWSIDLRPWWEIEVWGDATWFVDPPYQGAGQYYRHSHIGERSNVGGWKGGKQASDEEYARLGGWCERLPGQVIVCENAGANWLPFRPLRRVNGQNGTSVEAIWTNTPDPQRALFGEAV